MRWQLQIEMVRGKGEYYFPLQRAQNDSQYFLGRTFLQEAYLIVDYERDSFTLAQAQFPSDGAGIELVSVLSPSYNTTSSNTTSNHSRAKTGISGGAIAGIAVGGAAVLIAFALLLFYILRRRMKKQVQPPQVHEQEDYQRR